MFKIIEDARMLDEDWSNVRSPSRARRRLRRHRQNIVYTPKKDAYTVDGITMIMHPATAAEFRAQLKARAF